jgi:hypothetical protein
MITLTLFDIPFLTSVISGVPPVPAPDGAVTWDSFVSYSIDTAIHGLNQGSNEWNNTTLSASYVEYDPFLGVHAIDVATDYSQSVLMPTQNGGSGSSATIGWGGPWIARRSYMGIWCFADFEAESTGVSLNGSTNQPDARYQSFSPWKAGTSGSAA